MKRVTTIFATALLATLAIWWAPQIIAALRERPGHDRPAVAYLGSATRLEAGYRRWTSDHEARGGDRNVTLALRWSRGLSSEYSKAVGQARLDLIEGTARVEVRGLPGDGWEVWLVDNQPGPGRSVAPEPGDTLVRVGPLQADGDVARLEARLGAVALQAFELDLVVVARAGGEPWARGVLFGSPDLFQRLYTRARTGHPSTPDETAGSPLLGWFRPVAHATPVAVASFNPLVIRGAQLFFTETFKGNGRTCGTCHPAENNFTIDPRWIATLGPRDPLFVAEFVPALSENFEKPKLMRQLGLILENLDGFDDLRTKFVMRSVPHIFALNTSLKPPPVNFDGTTTPPTERTGWSGDGAPGGGTLREFAIGAVTQHFTRTLARRAGIDFRLPTDDELDAMEAFQRFVGRDADPDLATLRLKSAVTKRGKEIFLATDTQKGTVVAGKCQVCHANGGANVPGGGNVNFATGVENLVDQPGDLIDVANNPPDGGFGSAKVAGVSGFGNGTFNTPPLIEAADTPPFFHNNAISTIEEAVGFFNSSAFANSPSGQFLAATDSGGIGVHLEATHVQAVASFLRVLNALENIRAALERQTFVLGVYNHDVARALLRLALKDTQDAIDVLDGAQLHPVAIQSLRKALERTRHAADTPGQAARNALIRHAIADQGVARRDMVE